MVRVWSIGHSDRSADEFAELLAAHGVTYVADVRTVPKSLKHPQFHTDELARWLPERGVGYGRVEALGGWRKALPDSPNAGWQNKSFRGYADYAMTQECAAGLQELRTRATAQPTAMMCSEAVWWRCHRRLVADRLILGGDEVLHIMSATKAPPHEMTTFAVVEGGQITYPPEQDARS